MPCRPANRVRLSAAAAAVPNKVAKATARIPTSRLAFSAAIRPFSFCPHGPLACPPPAGIFEERAVPARRPSGRREGERRPIGEAQRHHDQRRCDQPQADPAQNNPSRTFQNVFAYRVMPCAPYGFGASRYSRAASTRKVTRSRTTPIDPPLPQANKLVTWT